jgi:hypothetical protein
MNGLEKKERSKRLRRWALVAGAVVGLACNLAPTEYQNACGAVTQVLSITCGGG